MIMTVLDANVFLNVLATSGLENTYLKFKRANDQFVCKLLLGMDLRSASFAYFSHFAMNLKELREQILKQPLLKS